MSLNNSNTFWAKSIKYAWIPALWAILASQMWVPVLATLQSTLAKIWWIISAPAVIGWWIWYWLSKFSPWWEKSWTTNTASALLGAWILWWSTVLWTLWLGALTWKAIGKLEWLSQAWQRNMAAYLALAATWWVTLWTGFIPTVVAAYWAYWIGRYIVSPLVKPLAKTIYKAWWFALKNTVWRWWKIIWKGLWKVKDGFMERANVLINPWSVFRKPQPIPVPATPPVTPAPTT